MDFENINIWCWLIPLLVGILCAVFGYLLGKSNNKSSGISGDLKILQEKNTKLEEELALCNQKLSSDAFSGSSFAAAAKPFDSKAARTALGKRVKEDDLKIVEGIGPKIEGLFHNYNIKTWRALSDTTVAKCQEVLDSGGEKYKIHDPASWPMQAKMCYENKWKDLHQWQEEHLHGKL